MCVRVCVSMRVYVCVRVCVLVDEDDQAILDLMACVCIVRADSQKDDMSRRGCGGQ